MSQSLKPAQSSLVNGDRGEFNCFSDPKQIFDTLNRCKLSEGRAHIWILRDDQKIMCAVNFKAIRRANGDFSVEGSPEDLVNAELIFSKGKTVFFYLMDDAIFFHCVMNSFEKLPNGGFRALLTFPETLTRSNRRGSIRLDIPARLETRVTFYKNVSTSMGKTNLQCFKKDLVDLSRGGCSFVVAKAETRFFNKRDVIAGITLEFEEKRIVLVGKVVNKITIEPTSYNGLSYKVEKVCLSFQSLSAHDTFAIDQFVLKHYKFTEKKSGSEK